MPYFLRIHLLSSAALWVAEYVAHLNAAIFSHLHQIQGLDKGQGDLGKFHHHDSSGALNSYIRIALLDFIFLGHRLGQPDHVRG